MIDRNKILKIIFSAIDEVNEQLPKNMQLEKSEDTIFYGNDGKLDSLGLVNFIVSVENGLEDEGINVVLADEKAMSQANSPFKNVNTLANFIMELTKE